MPSFSCSATLAGFGELLWWVLDLFVHFRVQYFLALSTVAIVLLVIPTTRRNEKILAVSCVLVFVGTWIDKGMGMVVTGFVPTPMHKVVSYIPTIPEICITVGIYALGFLLITGFYKIALSVREQIEG